MGQSFSVEAKKNIIKKLINNQDYRDEVIILIDYVFLNFCIDFFKQIAEAKIKNKDITIDWYKKEFLSPTLAKQDIAIHAGINLKTITNSYNSARREIVLGASEKNYHRLYKSIKELIDNESDLNLSLTIKFRKVSIELTINESMIVINTLAVKRAEIRGGLWSTVGKQIEKPLMITLCKLFDVPFESYDQTDNPESFREVDFYILSAKKQKIKVEVKLMGKGNPESADAIFARRPKNFVADKLSTKNRIQAEELGIEWVELRAIGGYKKFFNTLKTLKVPHKYTSEDFSKRLDNVVNELFP
jgi:hypothetical protein